MSIPEARRALVRAGRQLADWGLVIGTAGNLSVRIGTEVVVTSSGARLDELTDDDLVTIDLDGRPVGPGGASVDAGASQASRAAAVPTSETPLHLAIYGATEATAVAHTHAAASAAVSSVEQELPPLHYACLQLGGPVPVAPYATYGSEALARSVTSALGTDRFGALMANHGSITYGSGEPTEALLRACERLRVLEWLCELHIQAHLLGTPRVLTESELDDVRATTNRMVRARQAAAGSGVGEARA